jgi:hypothetical protein
MSLDCNWFEKASEGKLNLDCPDHQLEFSNIERTLHCLNHRELPGAVCTILATFFCRKGGSPCTIPE